MGRAPCCSKVGLQRGPWTPGEDALLTSYIQAHGEGQWRSLPKKAGLLRCGKSCRLRWMNYLRPDIKRGNISSDEEDLIIRMHSLLGNRWSLIAGRLPGRTDNEIKNYWNTHLAKRLSTTQGRRAQPKKSPQEKKRRKNNTKTSKKSHHKDNKERIVQEKPKIHFPKPVRLTGASRISNNLPRNDSLEINTASCDHFHVQTYYSSSQGGGGDNNINNIVKVNGDDDDINNIGVSFLFGDDDDDDVELTSNTVQKVYDEYLKILERDHHDDQLDSFN